MVLSESWFTGEYFETFTGKHFYLLNPRPEDVCIEDIAHSLARTCRYGGHVRVENYSVAEHSCLMAEYVMGLVASGRYTRLDALEALMHDAGEAYYGDIKRPIKHEPTISAVLTPIFDRIDHVVRGVFGLPWTETTSCKVLDRRIVRDERVAVMGGSPSDDKSLHPPLGVSIRGLLPNAAEEWFLRLYKELTE